MLLLIPFLKKNPAFQTSFVLKKKKNRKVLLTEPYKGFFMSAYLEKNLKPIVKKEVE